MFGELNLNIPGSYSVSLIDGSTERFLVSNRLTAGKVFVSPARAIQSNPTRAHSVTPVENLIIVNNI